MNTDTRGNFLFVLVITLSVFLLLSIFYELGVFDQALAAIAVLTVLAAVVMIFWVIYRHRKNAEPPEDFLRYVLVSEPAFATYHAGLEGNSFTETQRVELWENAKGRCENVIMGKRCEHRTFLYKPRLNHARDLLELIGMWIKNVFIYHQFTFYYSNAAHWFAPKNYNGQATLENGKHFCHVCNIRMKDSFTMEGLKIIYERRETVCLSLGAKVYMDGVPVMVWTEYGLVGIYD